MIIMTDNTTTRKEVSFCKKISCEEFYEYQQKGEPVVIQGALEDYPARKWTLEYLNSKVGENKVYIRSNTNTEDYKVGKRYNIEHIQFQEYANLLLTKDRKAKKYYLAVQNIKTVFPQIVDEFPVPPYVGKVHAGPYLWIGADNHYEFCHFDPDDGILCMISGTKTVKLYSHKYLKNLYPNPLGSKGRTVQSQVNCDNPDLQKYPLFKDTPYWECTIGPGDMLFIPAFCWHQVTAHESSISVNIFFGESGSCSYLEKIFNTRWEAFSFWMLNVVEQNLPYPSFQRVLARLPESLYCFFQYQYSEEATPELLNKLVKLITEYCKLEKLPENDDTKNRKYPTKLKIRGLLWRK